MFKSLLKGQAMPRMFIASILVIVVLGAAVVGAQNQPSATLEGFAVLPADSFAEGPVSGAFIDPTSNLNGREIPFESQPVQGVSAILPAETEGNWLVMSDNGFGAKGNSADYNLRVYEVNVDWEAQTVSVVSFFELSDPNSLVPFAIVNQDTEDRTLTGADFDLESFRRAADGTFWFGEEFGPFLLQTDATGRVLRAPIPTPYPEVLAAYARGLEFVQAPQNPAFVDLADDATRNATANHRTSRGFEGMALNTSGTMLYTMLEGSLVDDPFANRLLIQEFDVEAGEYTGRYFFYAMNSFGNAIGEMTAINDNQFLVIERDNFEGNAASFKRIFLVDLTQAGPDGSLPKRQIVDLMNIGDINGLTATEDGAIGFGEVFTFPFVTIESVYPVDADTLLVVNDNNFPFSSGRRPGVDADSTEFILIGLNEQLDLDMGM
ncbi:MAG: esterase-like activity of phytase family protein [Chloroflexota bacterium]|nr:esterase-like activity of phytase family protein [Chloroflexota bacterium]